MTAKQPKIFALNGEEIKPDVLKAFSANITNNISTMECKQINEHRFEGLNLEDLSMTEAIIKLPQLEPMCSVIEKSLIDSEDCDIFDECNY